MGISIGPSKCSCNYSNNRLPNPDLKNFEIQEVVSSSEFTLVKINYPDCTNYEGNKILLYKNEDFDELLKQDNVTIDPHFCKDCPSPVARFEPTERGWRMGISLIEGKNE